MDIKRNLKNSINLIKENQLLEYEILDHLNHKSELIFEQYFNLKNNILSIPEMIQNWKCILFATQNDIHFIIDTLEESLKPSVIDQVNVNKKIVCFGIINKSKHKILTNLKRN